MCAFLCSWFPGWISGCGTDIQFSILERALMLSDYILHLLFSSTRLDVHWFFWFTLLILSQLEPHFAGQNISINFFHIAIDTMIQNLTSQNLSNTNWSKQIHYFNVPSWTLRPWGGIGLVFFSHSKVHLARIPTPDTIFESSSTRWFYE